MIKRERLQLVLVWKIISFFYLLFCEVAVADYWLLTLSVLNMLGKQEEII